jgi:WD40 repeat protein
MHQTGLDVGEGDVTFGPGDRQLAIAAGTQTSRVDDDAVWLWNTENGKRLLRSTEVIGIDSVSFEANGAILAVRTGGRTSYPEDDFLQLWDIRNGQPLELEPITAEAGDIHTAIIGPDGRTLLIRNGDEVQLLALDGDRPLNDGRLIGTLPDVSTKIFSDPPYFDAKYNPNGLILVTGQPNLRFWRSGSAELLGVDEATVGASNVIFKSDNDTAVIFKNDGNPDVYNEEGRYEIHHFPAYNTPVGRFEIPAGEWIFPEQYLTDLQVDLALDSLAFSADLHFLAAPGPRDTVTLWDLREGHQLSNLSGHTKPAIQAEFTKDNCRLVTASNDGTVRVWLLPPCR